MTEREKEEEGGEGRRKKGKGGGEGGRMEKRRKGRKAGKKRERVKESAQLSIVGSPVQSLMSGNGSCGDSWDTSSAFCCTREEMISGY